MVSNKRVILIRVQLWSHPASTALETRDTEVKHCRETQVSNTSMSVRIYQHVGLPQYDTLVLV
jgi:hypothetical protein